MVAKLLRWFIRCSLVFTLGVFILFKGLEPPTALHPTKTEFEIKNATIINPGLNRIEGQTLIVRNGVIESIRPSEFIATETVPATTFVLPGLIDAHTHLPPGNALNLTSYHMLLQLAFGVTSIRDAGDLDGTALPAFHRIESEYPGPRVFSCGRFITAGVQKWKNSVLLKNAEDADTAVAQLKAESYSCVKSYDNLTTEMIRALRMASQKYGLSMIGHVPEALSYEEALIPNAQHFYGVPRPESLDKNDPLGRTADWTSVDDKRVQEIVEFSVNNRLANTPTLVFTQQLLLYRDYAATATDPIVQLLPRFFRDVVWNPKDGIAISRQITSEQIKRLEISLEKKLTLVRQLYEGRSAS